MKIQATIGPDLVADGARFAADCNVHAVGAVVTDERGKRVGTITDAEIVDGSVIITIDVSSIAMTEAIRSVTI